MINLYKIIRSERSDFDVVKHLDNAVIRGSGVECNHYILDIALKSGGVLWGDQLRVNVLIQAHKFAKVFFELLEFAAVGPHNFLLLPDLLMQVSDFLIVVVDAFVKFHGDVAFLHNFFFDMGFVLLHFADHEFKSVIVPSEIIGAASVHTRSLLVEVESIVFVLEGGGVGAGTDHIIVGASVSHV